MKWDIDKSLTGLEATDIPGTTVSRIVMDIAFFKKHGIKPTPEQEKRNGGMVWCLTCGKQTDRKLFFYGQTIHEAYLKARRAIRHLTALERLLYGLKTSKKRNSYASARRKKTK